ncbi:aromatic amino acid transport family protein [Shewanella youngdeokensis]|uniref:Aromatic amino acid transport family protein n=1 Tax=Shewanella youngdeokensis TaxID=2999068 RepID=A0ABZ0JXF5_9GAMM|nr:aromatic amino acid transport family protein [Shewanella sp. DAU334]
MNFAPIIYGATLVCITAIGPTMFILPSLIPKSEYGLSILVMLPVFCVMLFTALLVANITATLPQGSHFNTMIKHYLGESYHKVVRFLVLGIILSLVYSNICGLKMFFDITSHLHIGGVIAVILAVMILLIIRGFVSYVHGFLCILFAGSLIGCILLFHFMAESTPTVATSVSLDQYQWIYLIPAVQASFSFHLLIPGIVNACQQRKRDYQTALILGMGTTFIVYALWIHFAWKYDYGIEQLMSSGMGANEAPLLSNATQILFLLSLVSSSLGLGIAVMDYAKELSRSAHKYVTPWSVFAMILTLPLALFTFAPNGFQAGVFFSVFGSTFLAIILPSSIALKRVNGVNQISSSITKQCMSSVVLAYGLFSLCVNALRLT